MDISILEFEARWGDLFGDVGHGFFVYFERRWEK
jgi:hypothetical protein